METNWISSLPNNIVKEVAVTPGVEDEELSEGGGLKDTS